MHTFWLFLCAAAAGAVPAADQLPASFMLGKSSTDTSRAFSRCRVHKPSPLVKACEINIGAQPGVALFLFDSAQRVEQVDVVFPVQAARAPAAAQARALRALNRGFSASKAQADAKTLVWNISTPQLRGEVRLQAEPRGWMVSGSFRNPAFAPAYF